MKRTVTFATALLFTFLSCEYPNYQEIKKPEAIRNIDYTPAASTIEEAKSPCPSDMKLIEGDYCTNVNQICIKYLEDPKTNPRARCAEFAPSTCNSKKKSMSYCIDTEEFSTNNEGKPISNISWTQAKSICEANSKRLCTESEWTFACEGQKEPLPYPTGYKRPSDICNIDMTQNIVCGNQLCNHSSDIKDNPLCISSFGVHNMIGSIDEWVILDKTHYHSKTNEKMNSGLKGGWWGPLRNNCFAVTVDHDEHFKEEQTGFRCCADTEK